MSSFGVVLDTCVMVPAATRDTLLRAAEVGMYRPFWSSDILDELGRTITRLLSEYGHLDAEEKSQRLVAELRSEFPEAIVSGYERFIPVMTNDPKDRHVLAAAVAAKAQLIVTENLQDFPEASLAPHQLEAQSADEFLQNLFDLDPETICWLIEEQGADLRNPRTFDEQLQYLSRQLPGLVSAVRGYVSAEMPC